MGKRFVFLAGGIAALLCLYATTVEFSCAPFWAGLAIFAGTLVGTAGAISCRLSFVPAVLGSILGSLSIALMAYHVFGYRKYGQIHEVIWFGILGGVLGLVICAAFFPKKVI
jgi:hypothetical protein